MIRRSLLKFMGMLWPFSIFALPKQEQPDHIRFIQFSPTDGYQIDLNWAYRYMGEVMEKNNHRERLKGSILRR